MVVSGILYHPSWKCKIIIQIGFSISISGQLTQFRLILRSLCLPVAVVNQKYTVQVHDEYVMVGNTALLKCQVPTYMSEIVMVTAWVQDTGMHLYPNTDIGGKYIVLANGDLYVDNVTPNDAHKSYSCRTVNRLTGETQSSAYPGRIIITEPKGVPVQPRISSEKQSVRHVVVNGHIVLPCIAQGHPAPTYRLVHPFNRYLPLHS